MVVERAAVDATRDRSIAASSPSVRVGAVGNRTGCVAAWVISVEVGIVVAAPAAVIVAADDRIVEPVVTARGNESGAHPSGSVASAVAAVGGVVVA